MRDAVLTPFVSISTAALWASLFLTQGCDKLKSAGDCAHRQPPPPPAMKGGGGALDLYLALYRVDFGTYPVDDAGQGRYLNLGWDLDNTCTGEGQGPSCIEPLGIDQTHIKDGVDGIDNAFGLGWKGRAADFVTTEPNQVGGLIRIRQYNGLPNDDQVEVSLYYSFGLSAREDGKLGLQWDGEDRWNILPESLEAPEAGPPSLDQPKYVDAHAYVTNGVLVARLEDALSIAYLSTTPTHLWGVHRGVFAGPLFKTDSGIWQLDAVAGFRVSLAVVAQASALVATNGSSTPLCQSSDFQMWLRNACSYADISYDDDSPSAKCDAMSTGYAFHATQARPGELASSLQGSAQCEFSMYSCDLADN